MAAVRRWAGLPSEVLDNIFQQIPRYSRHRLGQVCRSWREALHAQAVAYLTADIEKQRIEVDQLQQLGWTPEGVEWWRLEAECVEVVAKELAASHDSTACRCIFFVFRYLSEDTVLHFRQIYKMVDRRHEHRPCAVAGTGSNKVLFEMQVEDPESGELRETIQAVDRAAVGGGATEEKAAGGAAAARLVGTTKLPVARLCSSGDLLATLQVVDPYVDFYNNRKTRKAYVCDLPIQQATISLWRVSTERWLQDLDFVSRIPDDLLRPLGGETRGHVRSLAMSRSRLAVHLRLIDRKQKSHRSLVLLWCVNTTSPPASGQHPEEEEEPPVVCEFLAAVRCSAEDSLVPGGSGGGGGQEENIIEMCAHGTAVMNDKYLIVPIKYRDDAGDYRYSGRRGPDDDCYLGLWTVDLHAVDSLPDENSSSSNYTKRLIKVECPWRRDQYKRVERYNLFDANHRLEPGQSNRLAVYTRDLFVIVDLETERAISSGLVENHGDNLYVGNWLGGDFVFVATTFLRQSPPPQMMMNWKPAPGQFAFFGGTIAGSTKLRLAILEVDRFFCRRATDPDSCQELTWGAELAGEASVSIGWFGRFEDRRLVIDYFGVTLASDQRVFHAACGGGRDA